MLHKHAGQVATFASLGFLAFAAGLLAQEPQWRPQRGSQVTLIRIDGSKVATHTLEVHSPDPWSGLRWPNCGAPDPRLYARRYFGGDVNLFGKGFNCTGFQNELANRGARAVAKAVSGSISGYVPLCMEVIDFNCTHSRSCQAYGLTLEDGCGGGGTAEPPDELPRRLVEYCAQWGWQAPGHPGPANAACKAYRGCERSSCGCFDERRSTTATGGTWVFFDPTRALCRPDRTFEDGEETTPPDTSPPTNPPPDTTTPPASSADCTAALDALEAAMKAVRRVCSESP